MKYTKLILLVLAAMVFMPLTAIAGTFDGSQPVICAVIETFECDEGIACQRGLAESINLPQFLKIDFKKKTITGTLQNGLVRTTEIKNMETHVGKLILQGVQKEMGWSIAIMTKTGKMVLSVAGEAVGFSVFGACIPDCAKESEAAPIFADSEQFDMIWSALQSDKQILFSQTIDLTNEESSAFWPVFESFQKDLKKLAQGNFNLFVIYASKQGVLSDDEAGKMLGEYLALEEKRIALKKSYVEKFKKILPQKKMMRYYQLENKIEAILKFEIAINTPVVE